MDQFVIQVNNRNPQVHRYTIVVFPQRSIPNGSNSWKAMADNKTDTVAMNISHV
jgi:hypothetical protein